MFVNTHLWNNNRCDGIPGLATFALSLSLSSLHIILVYVVIIVASALSTDCHKNVQDCGWREISAMGSLQHPTAGLCSFNFHFFIIIILLGAASLVYALSWYLFNSCIDCYVRAYAFLPSFWFCVDVTVRGSSRLLGPKAIL